MKDGIRGRDCNPADCARSVPRWGVKQGGSQGVGEGPVAACRGQLHALGQRCARIVVVHPPRAARRRRRACSRVVGCARRKRPRRRAASRVTARARLFCVSASFGAPTAGTVVSRRTTTHGSLEAAMPLPARLPSVEHASRRHERPCERNAGEPVTNGGSVPAPEHAMLGRPPRRFRRLRTPTEPTPRMKPQLHRRSTSSPVR
jgi:hypothetical protein